MNKLIFTAILSGFAGLYAMGQNEIRLMDMDLNKSYQTYGGAVKGKSVTNEPASIQGKTYDDVIGVQAKSHIKIDLHKNASRFQAQVGIADSHIDYTDKSLTVIPFVDGTKMYFDTRKNAKTFVGLEGKDGKVHPGSVLFILKGDNKELYNSGIVKLGDAPKTIDIPLNGCLLYTSLGHKFSLKKLILIFHIPLNGELTLLQIILIHRVTLHSFHHFSLQDRLYPIIFHQLC